VTPQKLEHIAVPDDLAACQKMVGDLIGACRELFSTVAEQNERIETLQHRLDVLTRAKFGRSSEALKEGQLRLFGNEECENVHDETESVNAPAQTQRGGGHGRRKPSKQLPRRRVVHELTGSDRCCPGCGVERQVIGEDVTERLAYFPALVQVVEEVRLKYACKQCAEHVAIAALPAKPIPKGLADATMLAYIATSKFADHIPLHRLEGIFRRHGAEIARSTMCDWLGATADLVTPIYDRMKSRVLESRVIWTDDTPVDMQDRSHPRNIREARVWTYLGDCNNRLAVFDFTESRRRDGPAKFLGNFSGYLQADAYAGYDHIYATDRVREVACWAHARRKFFDARKSNKRTSDAALRHIRLLYKVEAKCETLSPAEKLRMRKRFSTRILSIFKRWLDSNVIAALPKSPLGKAITYALNNWNALCTFTEDAELTPDNNKAENALRGVAVGRKNWMFVGSADGGRRAAVITSLIASCKFHNVNPIEYFTDVLNQLCANADVDIDSLVPDRWAANH
jgi:transposase